MKRLPGDAEAWYALGVAAVEAGRTDEAIYALVHAVELAPDDVDRGLASAEQLRLAGCHEQAEKIYRQAMQLAPDRVDIRAGLIRSFLDRGLDAFAQEEVERALMIDAEDVDLRSLAAESCERNGELGAAIDHLEAALTADPDHPELNRRLAGVLSRTGERGRSITALRRVAAHAGPDEIDTFTALGIELSHDGQHTEALEVLFDVVARAPELSSAHANLGMALLAANQLEESVSASLRALELDGGSGQAYCGLGLAYQRLERLEEAAQAFTACEQLMPESPVGPLNLAVVLDALGQREEARLALLRAAALAPEDREIHEALNNFLAASAQRGDTVPEAAPLDASIRGELKSFQLFDVLEFLRLQSKSGSLVVSSRHGAGIVRLTQGALTSASAPGTPRLGDVLRERGLLTLHQLNTALGKQRGLPDDTAEALGEILLHDKIIDRTQLGKLVFEQAL
ncbi:MAG TPA: tetratricopeptide repeat protein, partial [Polyangia bacterium]|nr:tetratricopeptide repeat protein [Polyangia bacterium]